MAVSQSNTMWVKKGTVVNGKKVKKGYVAQKGKPEKRVTNKIKLVVDTDKRGKAGETVQAKKGRYVKSTKKIKVDKPKPKSKGGGYTGNGRAGVAPATTKPKDTGKNDKPRPNPSTDTPATDTPATDTPKGNRTATSATVSGATKPKAARKPFLGGENKKYTPGREEPGQYKGNAKPKSRIDKIGERGPHGTAKDVITTAGKGAGKWFEKYGPFSDRASGNTKKENIRIGTVVTRTDKNGNKVKWRRTKNGYVRVKK